MTKKIYVLGNPYLKSDNSPLKLLPKMQKLFPKISFIHFDPTEELSKFEKNLILIDTVLGIHNVICISDLNHWRISPRNTVHDFDLPINLGILKKLGKIKKITIIGIPQKGNLKEIIAGVKKILDKLTR